MVRRSRAVMASVAIASVCLMAGCAKPGITAVPGTAQTPAMDASTPLPEPASTPEQTPETTPTPALSTPTPTPVMSTPTPGPALMAPGSQGAKVRELQARLSQLNWYEGDITGKFGSETSAAVEGFQSKRGLPVTGKVDQASWDALVSMTKMPTKEELEGKKVAGPTLFGPGSRGDRVKDLQARLKQIGWFDGKITGQYDDATTAGVKSFQGKRGLAATGAVDQLTLERLNGMTRKPTEDELNNVVRTPSPSPTPTPTPKPKPTPTAPTAKPSKSEAPKPNVDPRCMTGRVLCISKGDNKLRWMVDGQVQSTLAVRFGTKELPTREGQFSVQWKSRDHVSNLYHTPMPFALFFSGGQAVHYSPDFAANGYSGGSHGCVNVRDKGGMQALFDTVRVGDKVVVYR